MYCHESEFDYYVITLRLFYVEDLSFPYNVRNTLGILQVAIRLGCDKISDACVNYLEAVPWEEAEEKDILTTVSGLGLKYMSVFSRLQPVNPTATVRIFAATFRFASSSLPISLRDSKSSAQDQISYMLTKDVNEPDDCDSGSDGDDDDVDFLTTNDMLKLEVGRCVERLLIHFNDLVTSFGNVDGIFHIDEIEKLKSSLSDLSWSCQILSKMDMMRDLVRVWYTSSINVVKAVEILRNAKKTNRAAILKIEEDDEQWKVIRVVCMVLEAISYGNVILPTSTRLFMVNIWLPFVRKARIVSHDCSFIEDDNTENNEINTNTMSKSFATSNDVIWQCIESAFISIIVTLPSKDQAGIMAEWLRSDHVGYPDLTEAFGLWCHRSKIARQRFAFLLKKDRQ